VSGRLAAVTSPPPDIHATDIEITTIDFTKGTSIREPAPQRRSLNIQKGHPMHRSQATSPAGLA